MKRFILTVLLSLSAAHAFAQHPYSGHGVQGLVVLAEYRYDPVIQRWLADQELAALPLHNGKLYYIYPVHSSNAQLESMQIQYLESMLSKKRDEASEEEAEAEDNGLQGRR